MSCVETGCAGILVESVAEVAAAEKQPAARVIESRELPLGTNGLEREDGMLVGRAVEDGGRIDEILRVQRHEVVPAVGDSLQGVHPVMGGRPLMPSLMNPIGLIHPKVPGSPGQPSLRHDRGIGVEQGLVALVGEV